MASHNGADLLNDREAYSFARMLEFSKERSCKLRGPIGVLADYA